MVLGYFRYKVGLKKNVYQTFQFTIILPQYYYNVLCREADMGWCSYDGQGLLIGDFNGDGRDDLLCHDSNNGHKWVALANTDGSFSGTSWLANLYFVTCVTKEKRFFFLQRKKSIYIFISVIPFSNRMCNIFFTLILGICFYKQCKRHTNLYLSQLLVQYYQHNLVC